MVDQDNSGAGGCEAAPFTPHGLRELFRDQRVIRAGKLPSAEGFKVLAKDLSGLRRLVFLKSGPWREHDERLQRVIHAIRTLAKELPKEIEAQRESIKLLKETGLDAGVPMAERAEKAFVKLLDGVQAVLHDAGLSLVPLSSRLPLMERWRHLAPTLADLLVEAMRTTNPGWTFGRSNDGPMPRFIAAVVPHITGESPTIAAVAQFLKRNRDNGDAQCPQGH